MITAEEAREKAAAWRRQRDLEQAKQTAEHNAKVAVRIGELKLEIEEAIREKAERGGRSCSLMLCRSSAASYATQEIATFLHDGTKTENSPLVEELLSQLRSAGYKVRVDTPGSLRMHTELIISWGE